MSRIDNHSSVVVSRKRRLLFALLYFSEGAPIGFAWWALPTQLRSDGIDVATITLLTSLLAIPWAFKALWAPLIDSSRTARWGYRSWIIASQFAMGLALLPLAIAGPSAFLWLTFGCLILHAFFAATQDVAIDALCISIIPSGERGRANGWMQAGMLLGRAMFGGGTLVLVSAVGPRGGILLLIVLLWSIAALVSRSDILRMEPVTPSKSLTGLRTVVTVFRSLLDSRMVWYALGFGLIAGSVFEGVGSVAGPFLIDTGFSSEATGFFFSIPVIAAMAMGALSGGVLSDRIGAGTSTLWSFAALFFIVCALSAGLVTESLDPDQLMASLAVVYVGIGLFTASSYALFMDVSLPEYRATSFSAYMGATNLCESWSALVVGKLVVPAGYGLAFGLLAIVSLASLFFLQRLRTRSLLPIS